jgi:hypothetical protein
MSSVRRHKNLKEVQVDPKRLALIKIPHLMNKMYLRQPFKADLSFLYYEIHSLYAQEEK